MDIPGGRGEGIQSKAKKKGRHPISETERKMRGCAEVERSGNCELTHHQIISGFPIKELWGLLARHKGSED